MVGRALRFAQTVTGGGTGSEREGQGIFRKEWEKFGPVTWGIGGVMGMTAAVMVPGGLLVA